ncbi:MAG: hypothetical protein J1E00_06810 [Oscillospiraceae bacterium]|nr:hypothetical protein [Oscillospiraceae bacterium]
MANKSTKAISVLVIFAFALSLIVGCAADPTDFATSSDDASSENAVLEATSSDDSSTVESSAASSAEESDESEESTESSLDKDESEPEETSESADSATSRPDDESEPEPSTPSEQSKPETSKTETSSSEPSKETSKDDETSKENPSNTGSSHEHIYFNHNTVPPTATERGEIQEECSICGKIVTKYLYSVEEYAKLIRPYILKYVNQYRKEAGLHEVKLTQRRTEYSQYRAWQLTKNFSHAGMGEAAEATHCGYYTTDQWYNGEFFKGGWEGFTSEIITSTNYWTNSMIIGECEKELEETNPRYEQTIRGYAKHIVDNFYNSAAHRTIMLSSEDYYVGIGYYNGEICINFDIRNCDEINYSYDWQDENGKGHVTNIRDHKDENGNWIIDWEEQVL